MIKYYEVVETVPWSVDRWYRGYSLKEAEYCFDKNTGIGDVELREYEFTKEHEIDFENTEYMNELLQDNYKVIKEKKYD